MFANSEHEAVEGEAHPPLHRQTSKGERGNMCLLRKKLNFTCEFRRYRYSNRIYREVA